MDRCWLALLVGVALLANPVWLFPHADAPRHVYRAAPADPGDVHRDETVLVCGAESSSPCATERRAVTEGVAVGYDPAAFDDRPAFVYLEGRDRYYGTSVRWIDGARTATGVPVRYESVRSRVARDGPSAFEPPADEVVADALADGVARSRTRVALAGFNPDGPVVVEREGKYLAVRRTGRVRAPPFVTVTQAWPLRVVLAAVGIGVLTATRRR
jgi:hypothetical protein